MSPFATEFQYGRTRKSGSFGFNPDWFFSDVVDRFPNSAFDRERLTKRLALLPRSSRFICCNSSSLAAYEDRRREVGNSLLSSSLRSERYDDWAVARGAALFAERAKQDKMDWHLARRIPIVIGALGELQKYKSHSVWRELVEGPDWSLEVNRSRVNLAAFHGFGTAETSVPRWRVLQGDDFELVCYDTLLDDQIRGTSTEQHKVEFKADSGSLRDWSVRVPIVRPCGPNNSRSSAVSATD